MIMLDGYPGDAAARLATESGSPYDPDAFPDALTSLGFNVQRNSHSNYLLTPMTLASVLDMRHLVGEPGLVDAGVEAAGGRGFRRVADAGEALDVLHDRGYELVWVDGGFSRIEIRRVDRWIENGRPARSRSGVLSDTVLGPRDQRGCSGPALEPPPQPRPHDDRRRAATDRGTSRPAPVPLRPRARATRPVGLRPATASRGRRASSPSTWTRSVSATSTARRRSAGCSTRPPTWRTRRSTRSRTSSNGPIRRS